MNTDKLRKLYSSNEVAQLFIDKLAMRQRNRQSTSVDQAKRILSQENQNINRGEIVSIFRAFEEADCGQFVTDRHNNPLRFEWKVPMIQMAKAASGETTGDQDTIETSNEEIQDFLAHQFHLRPEITVELELPIDLTDSEAKRLADFVRALPFDQEE